MKPIDLRIAEELGVRAQQVAAAISLLTWCAHLIIAVTKPSAAILLLIRGNPSSI
jgi:hypothetical protein